MVPLSERTLATHFSFNSPFDEYGAVCWEDEKARLDNFAFALETADRATLGHIIVYDGKLACRGEAFARAIRAKKYLVEHRKLEADRILLRWGGYLEDMITTLVITPPGATIWPFRSSIPLSEVTFVGNCNGKVRPVTCPKWDAPNKRWRRTRRASALIVVASRSTELESKWSNTAAEKVWPTFFAEFRAAVRARDRQTLRNLLAPDLLFSLGHHRADHLEEAFKYWDAENGKGWKAFNRILNQGTASVATWWNRGAKSSRPSRVAPAAANLRMNIDRGGIGWYAIFEYREDGRWYCVIFQECCD